MGTYTTNKELYKPSVGETGWGTLVNGNFETIDNFLKPITVSGSTYTFTGNQKGGSVSATSITNSGTLTNTGKITANGGITGTIGTFSGAVTGASFNGVDIGAYTLNVTTTESPSFTAVSIYTLGVSGTSSATRAIAPYVTNPRTTNFGTVTGTLRFMYESDSDSRLYQFNAVNLPTSGITYQIYTRSNATLTIDGITCTSTAVNITRAQAIRLLTQRVNFTITTSGTSPSSTLFSLVFVNTTSSTYHIWLKAT